jgi:hypothetical protein
MKLILWKACIIKIWQENINQIFSNNLKIIISDSMLSKNDQRSFLFRFPDITVAPNAMVPIRMDI